MWRRTFCTAPSLASIHTLHLRNFPVLAALQLEECILRCRPSENWLITASSGPLDQAVVLGISARVPQLVHAEACHRDGVPLIKRYSGGGTVLLNQHSPHISLLTDVHVPSLAPLQPFPRDIMDWTRDFYNPVFSEWLPRAYRQHVQFADPYNSSPTPTQLDFRLNEHDYCIGGQKFGGNAQSLIRGGRFAHHTSMLWQVSHDLLEKYLRFPDKVPEYRDGRSHTEFVSSLTQLLGVSEDDMDDFTEAALFELTKRRAHDFFEPGSEWVIDFEEWGPMQGVNRAGTPLNDVDQLYRAQNTVELPWWEELIHTYRTEKHTQHTRLLNEEK